MRLKKYYGIIFLFVLASMLTIIASCGKKTPPGPNNKIPSGNDDTVKVIYTRAAFKITEWVYVGGVLMKDTSYFADTTEIYLDDTPGDTIIRKADTLWYDVPDDSIGLTPEIFAMVSLDTVDWEVYWTLPMNYEGDSILADFIGYMKDGIYYPVTPNYRGMVFVDEKVRLKTLLHQREYIFDYGGGHTSSSSVVSHDYYPISQEEIDSMQVNQTTIIKNVEYRWE